MTKVGAGSPVGKSTPADLNGTGNLDPNAPTGGNIVVGDSFVVGNTATVSTRTASHPTTTTGSTITPSPLAGEGRGEGASKTTAATATTSSFPGQGLAHRSDRANEVARNTEKNKHLNGGIPGGVHGADNSNAAGSGLGGNGNNAGGNAGGNSGSTGGTNPGSGGVGGNPGGGVGGGSGTGGNTNGGGAGQGDGREFIFFYHPDHLGSTGYVTDEKALRYEHITYFPFGETWVQESNATWRVPYQFTSKEMDTETGLYYFGARYYDPRTSVWQSADPILGKYLPGAGKSDPSKLAGMGGVFNSQNLGLYTYTHQNPLNMVDPDGRESYLVSRQLSFTKSGNHNFIVSNAKSLGDPKATVYSFGDVGNDTMGLVTKDTKGFSKGTSDTDTAAWESLSGDKSSVTYRKINATDAAVDDLVSKVDQGLEYSLAPEIQGGVNSNTGAGAVAKKADSGSASVANNKSQPGTNASAVNLITFGNKPNTPSSTGPGNKRSEQTPGVEFYNGP